MFSSANNCIKVRGVDVAVNPSLLFMRITCVISDKSEMEGNLHHELALSPPSLFIGGMMRKALSGKSEVKSL